MQKGASLDNSIHWFAPSKIHLHTYIHINKTLRLVRFIRIKDIFRNVPNEETLTTQIFKVLRWPIM